jgi:hypothetical protein
MGQKDFFCPSCGREMIRGVEPRRGYEPVGTYPISLHFIFLIGIAQLLDTTINRLFH